MLHFHSNKKLHTFPYEKLRNLHIYEHITIPALEKFQFDSHWKWLNSMIDIELCIFIHDKVLLVIAFNCVLYSDPLERSNAQRFNLTELHV